MFKSVCWAVGVIAASASISMGALAGNASFAPNLLGPPNAYAGTVNNTGTATIGTFWFAWIPGQNYMGSAPLSVASPAGWTSLVTHGSSSDGWGIRWTATSAASFIAPGTSLSGFVFTSNQSAPALSGNSPFYPATPVGTSFLYIGAPFADPGLQIVATIIPAPVSACAFASLALPLLRRRRSLV